MLHKDKQRAQNVPFAKLEERMYRVPESTIRKKWKKLPLSMHNPARDALSVARQQARSRQGKNKTSQTVEGCVDSMLDRLYERLPQIPYPPSTDESHFDYEANINRANKLENQLNDDANGIQLLKDQIAREEAALHEEEDDLKTLQINATRQEQARKIQYEKLHPVAKEIGQDPGEVDILTLSGQNHCTTSQMTVLHTEPELQSLLQQLDDHLNSLSSNTAGIMAVTHAVNRAKTELMMVTNT